MKKKRSIAGSLQDIARLREDGWTVKKLSAYHYRVTMQGERGVVDLWPTARKLWRHGSGAGSRKYKDVCRAMATEFARVPEVGISVIPTRNGDERTAW